MDFELPCRNSAVSTLESTAFIAMNFASLLGNVMVCLAVYRNPRIRATTHLYIVALAVSDLSCAIGSMPFTATTLIVGQWLFGQTLCEIQAFIMYFVLNISPATMGLAALNRYMRIVKTNHYKKVFSKRRSKVLLLGVWLSLACYLLVARATGWLRFSFFSGYASCVVSFDSTQRRAVHYSIVISLYFAAPLLAAMISYYYVYQTIRRHNLDIIPSLQSKARCARISVHEINISKSLFMVMAGFLVCWLPMWVVVVILRFQDTAALHRAVMLLPVFLIYLSSTINPFIYAGTNRAYKSEFRRLFTTWRQRKMDVLPLRTRRSNK